MLKWEYRISKFAYYGGVLALFVIAFFLKIYKLGCIPYGMHIDEAGMAYDAWCLANYGVDRWLNEYPVYLTNFGGGQSALMAYLCALLVRLNGGNVTIVIARLPGVIISLCAWWVGVYIIQKFLGKVWGMIGALLLSIMPYFLLQCRFGLDCNLLVNMLTISVGVLIIAIEKKRIIWYIIAGILWGITYYTYALSYLPNTFGIILISALLLWTKRANLKQIFAWWIPTGILGLPLLGMLCVNQFQLQPIKILGFTITRLPNYRGGEFTLHIDKILQNIRTEIVAIMAHDQWSYNSFPDFYNFYKISIPFLIIGLCAYYVIFLKRILKRNFECEMILGVMWILYFGIGMVLGGDGPNVNKLNGLMFFQFFFILYGIKMVYCIIERKLQRKGVSKVFIGVLMLIYLFQGANFATYYYTEYATKIYPQSLFDSEYSSLLEGGDKTTYIDCRGNSYIYFLYSLKPNPFEYNLPNRGISSYENYVLGLPDEYDPNGKYIVHEYNQEYIDMLLKNGCTVKDRENMFVSYE